MDRLKAILAEAQTRLAVDPSTRTVDWLALELGATFDEAIVEGQLPDFQKLCRSHPLAETFLLDPYARRAFEKPRGYAGDAVMLDYIYRPGQSSLDGLAGILHAATTTLPNAKSILWRQDYLATLIENSMGRCDNPEILSVASGHMRELDRLRALTNRTNASFTALDTDAASLSEVKAAYPEYNIATYVGNCLSLPRLKRIRSQYDLIYSAGLFDYLQDSTAIKIIAAMVKRLKPGGLVSIGNFSRDSHGRGFMAGFLDWCLIYRDENDLRALADAACPKAPIRIFRDQPGNVVYLEVFAER
ncbi:MAG: class I SAM-dependent methyltransferase [Parafilimonas terrae]|nr:class I SAM-dependent methyltransferase [Parafilimonas terrae]